MRRIALPTALGVTTVLHLLCYVMGLPPGPSTIVSTAIGCAAYVVMRVRQPSE